jgi:dolichol-phosphate mannosyltransferase
MKIPYKIAVIIPTYKAINHILDVVSSIGPEVDRIYVVDDCCPDGSGDYLAKNCTDPRVNITRHARNLGVGGAVMTGYAMAARDDMKIRVSGF